MFNRQKVLDRLTNHKPYINGSEYMRRAAVFIPMVRKDGEIHVYAALPVFTSLIKMLQMLLEV